MEVGTAIITGITVVTTLGMFCILMSIIYDPKEVSVQTIIKQQHMDSLKEVSYVSSGLFDGAEASVILEDE